MGNLCGKRQKYELKRHPAELQRGGLNDTYFNKIHVKGGQQIKHFSLSEGRYSQRQRKDKRNNLELYLNDIYEKECVVKAEEEEVEFIRNGIETLVLEIVDLVLEEYSLHIEKNKILRFYNDAFAMDVTDIGKCPSLEVYFPIKGSKHYQCVDVKPARESIIKAGSFYEETKNNFPDEFDFIFVLFCVKTDIFFYLYDRTAAHTSIKAVSTEKKEFLSYVDGERKLYLEKYVKENGPASMLQFVYVNSSGGKRYIHVDLVPAYKIIDCHNLKWYVEYVSIYIKPKSFFEEVMLAGSCLNVRGNILSFTETEIHFIRNILSKKHVKVFRILKFLINGHGDGEELEQYTTKLFRRIMREKDKGYSSYQIKTMMIYHHDECKYSDMETVGPCVLQVLREMCKYDDTSNAPSLYPTNQARFHIIHELRLLVSTLTSMQISGCRYDYESVEKKSVSKQHLDDLEKEHPTNLLWHGYNYESIKDGEKGEKRLKDMYYTIEF